MVTGDNPLTAATIAAEAGVDDFVAQAKPEDKIAHHSRAASRGPPGGDDRRRHQRRARAGPGRRRPGDELAARPRPRKPANMVDLDSNPTKLIEVVAIGKQLLITRGAITTFSVANDVAKYFAIIPAAFVATYPELNALNIMQLATPGERDPVGGDLQRADHHRAGAARAARRRLSAVRRPRELLARNLLIYGVGGIIAAVHRDQAHRPHRRRAAPGLEEAQSMSTDTSHRCTSNFCSTCARRS